MAEQTPCIANCIVTSAIHPGSDANMEDPNRGDEGGVADMDVESRLDAAMSGLQNSIDAAEHEVQMSRLSRAVGNLEESMAKATNEIIASNAYRQMIEKQNMFFDPTEVEASDKQAADDWNKARNKYELQLNEAIEWMKAKDKWPGGIPLVQAGQFRGVKGGHTFTSIDRRLPTWIQQVCAVWNKSRDMVDGLYGAHILIRRVKDNDCFVNFLLLIDRDKALAPLKRRLVEFAQAEGALRSPQASHDSRSNFIDGLGNTEDGRSLIQRSGQAARCSVIYHAKSVNADHTHHQKIGIANVVRSLSKYFEAGDAKRRAPLQPRVHPTEPKDVVLTVIAELTGESILCPRNPTKHETIVKDYLMQVCEMTLTYLFVGSIKDCPGIGMYGTFLCNQRNDERFEQVFQEFRVSALLGEEPAHSRHMHSPDPDPRLKFLSNWYHNTMAAYDNGSLLKERRDLLDEHGFKTTNYGRTTNEDQWYQSFCISVRYFRVNDFCYPPLDRRNCSPGLEEFVSVFVCNARTRINSHDECNWKVKLLNSINFVWDWRREFPDLVDKNHGTRPLKKGKVIRKAF